MSVIKKKRKKEKLFFSGSLGKSWDQGEEGRGWERRRGRRG